MRKEGKPRTIKGLLKELVEVCESCGGTDFQVTTYEYFPGPGKKSLMQQLAESFVPTDPQEYRALMRRRDQENRHGLEVSYFCSDCNAEFVQFYPQSAWDMFVGVWKQRYGDFEKT